MGPGVRPANPKGVGSWVLWGEDAEPEIVAVHAAPVTVSAVSGVGGDPPELS